MKTMLKVGLRNPRNWMILSLAFLGFNSNAFALPAFAIREKVSCTLCHTNGSAPHLTKFGYLYRRAGFRVPTDIGNIEKDDKATNFASHMAAGINVDYEVITQKDPGADKSKLVANQFNVPEVEVWPLVGSFRGNFAAWSEIDATPGAVSTGGGATQGSIGISQADLRYVTGNSDLFFNFRSGMIAGEGYGASDQWLDDGNIPLFDLLTAQYNQNTLALPFGAMGVPQLGAEAGANYLDTHITVGIYNGFEGTSGLATTNPSVLNPALMNQVGRGSKDYKVQIDQFFWDNWAVTASFYNGRIPLTDPTNSVAWMNHFSSQRLYLTVPLVSNTVELLGGGSYGTFEWFDPNAGTAGGTFHNRAAFVGANYYVMPHLTLSGRVDHFEYNFATPTPFKANGFAGMISFPFENNLFILHFNNTLSDLTGLTNDFRLEWRFLF